MKKRTAVPQIKKNRATFSVVIPMEIYNGLVAIAEKENVLWRSVAQEAIADAVQSRNSASTVSV